MDTAALHTEPAAASTIKPSVLEKSSAPCITQVKEGDAIVEVCVAEELEMVEPAPEIPLGEPIEPPFPTYLPEAYLILAGEVAGTPQQSPTADDTGATGTSSSGILVVPHGALGDVASNLIDDPMLSNEPLMLF
jgi:hypothetical protein